MNSIKSLRVVAMLLSCARLAGGGAAADDAAPGSTHVALVRTTYAELSDRTVSRLGDQALAMSSVGWEHSESDHFIFHTATGFAVAQLADAAEGFYAAIKRDLGISEDTFQRKSHVFVFLDEAAWREFAGTTRLDAWTGGLCTGRELFFHVRAHFRFQGTTLPHELTHLVLHRFVGGDIPLWLNEGFAEFEATRLYRGYLKRRDYHLRSLARSLEPSQYQPLTALTGAVDYPTDQKDVTAFYAESERLVSFLSRQSGGLDRVLQFMKRQSAGLTFEAAVREIYRAEFRDLKTLETAFRASLFEP